MSVQHVIAKLVGEQLATLRVDRGMSQRDMALRLGSHREIVSRTERGCHVPSLQLVTDWAKALGVGVVDVLTVLDHPDVQAEIRYEQDTPT